MTTPPPHRAYATHRQTRRLRRRDAPRIRGRGARVGRWALCGRDWTAAITPRRKDIKIANKIVGIPSPQINPKFDKIRKKKGGGKEETQCPHDGDEPQGGLNASIGISIYPVLREEGWIRCRAGLDLAVFPNGGKYYVQEA